MKIKFLNSARSLSHRQVYCKKTNTVSERKGKKEKKEKKKGEKEKKKEKKREKKEERFT